MQTLRISVTEYDQYKAYLDGFIDFKTLIRRLRKQDGFGRPPYIGTLWHNRLEMSHPQTAEYFEQNHITFVVECDYTLCLPVVKELKGVKVYTFGGLEVTLVGKADGLTGLTGIDHKLTMRPNVDRLSESFQWRAYCVIFGLYKFTYVVYKARNYDTDTITITDIFDLPLYTYPELESDVENKVREFSEFIVKHLPERIK